MRRRSASRPRSTRSATLFLRSALRSHRRLLPLRVALLEAVDAAGGVDQLLLAGEEGVALRADLEAQLLAGGAGGPGLAAGAVDRNVLIFRMNLWLHEWLP